MSAAPIARAAWSAPVVKTEAPGASWSSSVRAMLVAEPRQRTPLPMPQRLPHQPPASPSSANPGNNKNRCGFPTQPPSPGGGKARPSSGNTWLT